MCDKGISVITISDWILELFWTGFHKGQLNFKSQLHINHCLSDVGSYKEYISTPCILRTGTNLTINVKHNCIYIYELRGKGK